MGLDTTHDAWHGAYSSFSRWREELARVAGYEIVKVEGWHGKTIMIDWGHITAANLDGCWVDTPSDPLMVLIAHSDCDGWIHPPQAGPLAGRLEELLPLLNGDGGGHIGSYREKTQTFINGLRAAIAVAESIEFR